jgi:hypothetical protein
MSETANGRGGDTALVQSVRLDAGNALNSSSLPRGYAPRRCAHSPLRPFASQPCPFELKPLRKVRILLGLASNTLAKEDAVERDHLRSAIDNCREPYLYGLRRV